MSFVHSHVWRVRLYQGDRLAYSSLWDTEEHALEEATRLFEFQEDVIKEKSRFDGHYWNTTTLLLRVEEVAVYQGRLPTGIPNELKNDIAQSREYIGQILLERG